MKLVDTHAHLDDKQFADDLDSVVARATEAGVTAIVAVGTTVETSRKAVELAQKYPLVHAAVGIHPNYAASAARDDWQAICDLARDSAVVAIGETGLDRFRSDTPFDLQMDYFERHMALACEQARPIVIHCRDAEADVLACLEKANARGPVQGVMHSFTGRAATAARCVELGLFISFAGQITYTNRKFDALREVARMVPQNRLLLETDSPYLAPEPHRGRRNEPCFVTLTAERLADLRGESLDELARAATANARALFRMDVSTPP